MNFEDGQVIPNSVDNKNDAEGVNLPSADGVEGDLRRKVMAAAAGVTMLAGIGSAEAADPRITKAGIPVYSVSPEQVQPGSVKPSEKIIDSKHEELIKNIDKSKATPNSAWAGALLDKVTKAQEMVKDGTDAMSYLKAGYGAFAERYQAFLKSPEAKSAEDYLVVISVAQRLLDNFEKALDSKGVNRINMNNEKSFLRDAITRCESTYDSMKTAQTGPKFQF